MNSFFPFAEVKFEDCPLAELSREYKSEKLDPALLDKSMSKEIGGFSSDLVSKVASTGEGTAAADSADETLESKLEKTLKEYFEDLLSKSEFPETLSEASFDVSDMEKLSPDETALMREEFDDVKASLKRQWEEQNGQPWPKYEEDVYSANGKLIRKAGSDYDAHHIQPLGLGGKNEASNITPLHAEVHYDKQGIHAPDSPYSKMDKLLGGVD